MTLWVNSIAHLLVDGVCAATVFGALSDKADLTSLVLLYNTLAFSSQGLVGLVTDRLRGRTLVTAAACILVILGFALPVSDLLKVVLIGAGNSVFHVGGGTTTLLESHGRAWKLGIFVAPGCIGLALGTAFPRLGAIFAIALFACALLMITVARPRPELMDEIGTDPAPDAPVWIPVLLLVAVAVRAVGGTAVSFPWKDSAWLGILMTGFVFAGKALGGHVCDRLGARLTALLTVPAAAVLIAFCSRWMAPSLLGQLLLNLTMPVTLLLIYRALPNSPGFAFGLAASALWPGTIAGNFLTLTGPALWACVLASFGLSLGSILIACAHLRKEDGVSL